MSQPNQYTARNRPWPTGWIDNDRPAWQDGTGLCAQTDPEIFFPEKGGSTREAKQICLRCDLRFACLEDALARDDQHGIWGAKSPRERRKIQAQRRRANQRGNAA